MAGSVNKVILVGNLGRDPEVRRTGAGDPVVNFSLATSETWRDKASGERKERTEWHNIVIFNENLGKIAEQYCKKGTKVYLEGQLQTREYTDRDGNQRKATEVVLTRFRGELQLLDSRGRGDDAGGGYEVLQHVFRPFVAPGARGGAPSRERRQPRRRHHRRRHSILEFYAAPKLAKTFAAADGLNISAVDKSLSKHGQLATHSGQDVRS